MIGNLSLLLAKAQAEEDQERQNWELGDYASENCPNCGRQRLCKCANEKHRCEKCNWCSEINDYAPSV